MAPRKNDDDDIDDLLGDDAAPSKEDAQGERIAKRLSRAGVCSRRDAEKLIAEGRVKVNGEVLTEPGTKVLESDDIRVDNKSILPPEKPRVWLFHKPAGVITTNKDPEGRQTVFDILPKGMPRVISVGRLDLNSEGLLLFTNDGGIARHMELPATGWTRRYRVRVFGTPSEETLRLLKKGVVIDGIHYGSVTAKVDKEQGHNCWLTVSLMEGKKREIRVLFEHFGHAVSRLIRVSYGPFQLGELERGEAKEVPSKVLKSQLGQKFFP